MKEVGRQKPPASRAVELAHEAECATEYAARYLRRAMADGTVTIDEALEAVRLIEHALDDARQVVPVAEIACQNLILGTQFAVWGEVTPNAARNAATVGIEPPTFGEAA